MLEITPDETVSRQDMIDGSYIPNPHLHQSPVQFISANYREFRMSLQHTRSCSANYSFIETLYLSTVLIPSGDSYPCREKKSEFQPVKWEALLGLLWHLNFLFAAAAEHLDSVTQGKLFDTAVGYVAQFLWLSIS